jgi:hypothetical protein
MTKTERQAAATGLFRFLGEDELWQTAMAMAGLIFRARLPWALRWVASL